MSNVNNITSKILKDAEVRKDTILASAEEEKNKILSKKVNSAKEVEKEILLKAEVEAKSKKERVISSSKLKVRNDKLFVKQQILDEIFQCSIEKLTQLSKDDFLSFVRESILQMNLSGKQTLVLDKKGLEFVDESFIDDLNSRIDAEIIICETAAHFKGGFILKSNGIEINNTYEALVSSLRDDLEFEVAKVLFN